MLRLLALTVLASAIVGACSKPPDTEVMQLDGNLLTIDNRSSHDWMNVEVWVNRQYRAIAPKIAARSRVQVPLDAFVEGFGHRFDWHRAQVKGLQLTATLPDGSKFQTEKQFEVGGLRGVAETFKKK